MSLTLSPRYSVSSAATEPLRYPLMASTSATLLAFGTASPRFDPDPHRRRCGRNKNGRSSNRPCTLPRDVLRPARVAPARGAAPSRAGTLRYPDPRWVVACAGVRGSVGNRLKGSRSGRSDLRAIGNRTVFGPSSLATPPISRQTNSAGPEGAPGAPAGRARRRRVRPSAGGVAGRPGLLGCRGWLGAWRPPWPARTPAGDHAARGGVDNPKQPT